MVADTAIPEKKPLLVDTRGILQRQEMQMKVAVVTVVEGEPNREGSHNIIFSTEYLSFGPSR
jgi:hypothetical protein